MANKRGKGQIMLGFWANADLVNKIDSVRQEGISRSQWLRGVAVEHLRAKGVKVPDALIINQPNRIGIGGPKSRILRDQVISNEETLPGEDPMVAEAARSLALVAMRKVLAEDRESRRRGKAASTSVGKAPPSGGFGTG